VSSDRWVRMPASPSLPSGHSASAFAFATAVGSEVPALALPLHVVATAVAYSRVHTGVHYPADTLVGSVLGASVAQIVCSLTVGRGRTATRRPLATEVSRRRVRPASRCP
jgi:undecaprenyl-diphosphatase